MKQALFYIFNVGKEDFLTNEFQQFYTECLYTVDLIELKIIDDKINPSFLIGSGGRAKVYLATYNYKRAALKLNQKYTIGDCCTEDSKFNQN